MCKKMFCLTVPMLFAVATTSCDKAETSHAGVGDVMQSPSTRLIAQDIAAGNYGKAVRSAEQAIASNPNDPEMYFLLARAEAKLQNVGNATKALQASFDAGFHDPRGAMNHPDFDAIRSNRIFAELANRSSHSEHSAPARSVDPAVSTVSAGNVSIIEGSDGRSRIRAGDVVIED